MTYQRDPDEAYDQLRDDADAGLACPWCYHSGLVEKRTAKGIAPFRCMACNRVWTSWDDRIRALTKRVA
jgi:hypothetical protein